MNNNGRVMSHSYNNLKFQGNIDRSRLDRDLIEFTMTGEEDGNGVINPLTSLITIDAVDSYWARERVKDYRLRAGSMIPTDPGRPQG